MPTALRFVLIFLAYSGRGGYWWSLALAVGPGDGPNHLAKRTALVHEHRQPASDVWLLELQCGPMARVCC